MMPKPYRAKEFNKIAAWNGESEAENVVRLPQKVFDEFQTFIKAATSDKGGPNAEDFFSLRHSVKLKDYISVGKYVGLIEFSDGKQLEVLPKVDFSSDEDLDEEELHNKTVSIMDSMVMSLKSFPFKIYKEARLKVIKKNIYEFLIAMFIKDLQDLLKRGLKSNYVLVEDNLKYLKGKLLVPNQLRKNALHKEHFYVQYDEYMVNSPENKLIKATVAKLHALTSDFSNRKDLHRILGEMEAVEASKNYTKDFAKVIIDRNNIYYEQVMEWCEIFLYDRGFSIFSGESKAKSMLFSMNDLYESYVAKMMKKIFKSDEGWSIKFQEKQKYLFDNPKKFILQPDIVVRNGKQCTVIMDTKWKKLSDVEKDNYNISQSDMYQMFAYSKQYGAKDIWLLYPWNPVAKDIHNKMVSGKDYFGNEICIHVFLIKVDKIKESLTELYELLKNQYGI